MKTKCSMIAAAVLNLFIIASLNMSSVIGASFAIKVPILCNISIRNRVVGTRSNSRWRACWIVENLTIDLCVWFFLLIFHTYGLWCKNLIDAEIMAQIMDFRKFDLWPMGLFRLLIFHLDTKFGAKMLIDAEIMAKNLNSRWRPSAILEFLYHHIGPPTKSFRWATSACQILC